ncbi:hypothetical protein [Methanoregula sp.]|uniref:hypothetical protein n=1 Tax=Methanoregula sp. TaxID=2052170 RepID=UPI0035693A68
MDGIIHLTNVTAHHNSVTGSITRSLRIESEKRGHEDRTRRLLSLRMMPEKRP